MQRFYSKVLLFGEHTVVNGGLALAMPFNHFYGSWKFTTGDIDRDLSGLADYIDHHDYLFEIIGIDRFFADLDRGLIFDSNIPSGFGLGSSGALVAALYKEYHTTTSNKNIPTDLRQHLADLESHFHGQSSGFDPMVCYLNKPVLAENRSIKTTTELNLEQDDFQLFLMSTNVSRSTGPIVESFQAYIDIPKNEKHIDQVYRPMVNSAIDSILDANYLKLYTDMESISGYQYAYLDFLIDDGSRKIWKEGLASDFFKLKICGAGKGGFLLGITKNMGQLRLNYPSREIIPLR